ncbi:MAG: undecaprenyl-diphosphate phosphatase [Rubrobacteraceae bacterium]
MNLFEAFLVGFVGGISDFLPVGGSGHRILMERVFFGGTYNREFSGICQIFAALAAVVALRKEITDSLRSIGHPGGEGRRVAALLLAATATATFISLPFANAYAGLSGDIVVVGVLFLVSGLLIYIAEEIGRRTHPLGSLKLPGAMLVGLLGALAALPGISRTGATISGGMLLGLTRESATRFALFLSVPLLVVSGIWDISSGGGEVGPWASVFGAAASFVGGFLAVGFLRWYAREFSFMVFAYYLWVVGVFTIVYEYLG